MLELSVEQAQNTLEQGTLSVKSQLLGEQGKVKTAQIAVASAERELNAAKSKNPFSVQSLFDARKRMLVTQQEVVEAEATLKQV